MHATRKKLWLFNAVTRSVVGGLAAVAVVLAPLTPAGALTGSSLQSTPVGTVIGSSNMTLPTALRTIATGKRITYVSSNSAGQKIVVSGAVITPKVLAAVPRTVAWAHGSTGLADGCAPSTNLNVFWPEAVDAVKSYLQKGWVVAASDYPGLGSPGNHPYLVGDSQARAVIDSVRAARKMNSRLTDQWAVSGHSQGGQTALFAGEIADTYGQGLKLRGVVAMSPVSNAEIIGTMIPGTPGQGYLVMALYGLAAVDPTVNPDTILAQPAKDLSQVVRTGCLEQILYAYAPLTAEQLLVGGQLPETVIAKLAASANPAQQANTAPVMLVQGTLDQDVPADLTYLLHSQVCSYGTPALLQPIEGADHIGTVTQSIAVVSGYLTDRFAGRPAPTNCL